MRRLSLLSLFLYSPVAAQQPLSGFPVFDRVSIVGPVILTSLTRVEPPDWFRDVHADMEACTGHTRSFDDIVWYSAILLVDLKMNSSMYAVYFSPGEHVSENAIVMQRYFDNEVKLRQVVRHELVHYLAAPTNHDPTLFAKCVDA